MSNIEINHVMVSGIVTRDPESKLFGTEHDKKQLLKTVVTLSVKTFTATSGRMEVNVVFWGKQAEQLAKSVKRAHFIGVSGVLRNIPNSDRVEIFGKTLYTEDFSSKNEEDIMIGL